MKKSLARGLATIGLSVAIAVTSALPASATPAATTATAEELQLVRGMLLQRGVSPQSAEELVNKFAAGKPWDSMIESKKPVSTKSITTANVTTETKTFSDGSFLESTIESPPADTGGVQARGVTGCTQVHVGKITEYSGCWASESNGIITAGFSVRYSITINNNGSKTAKILATGTYSIQILFPGAGWKDVKLTIPTQSATSTGKAVARMTFVPTGATFGTVCRVDFGVTPGNVRTVNAWF